MDEVLLAAALLVAPDELHDLQEMYEDIPARIDPGEGDDEYEYTDEERGPYDDGWDSVSESFDEMAKWEDWEVPVRWKDHPMLQSLLDTRHPFTWFDDTAHGQSSEDAIRLMVADQTGLKGKALDKEIEDRRRGLARRVAPKGSED